MATILTGHQCKICGRPYEDLPYYEDQVGCPVHDAPPEAVGYDFECWDCGMKGSSINCRKSETPGMGYHCPNPGCGKDLTEWKGSKQ